MMQAQVTLGATQPCDADYPSSSSVRPLELSQTNRANDDASGEDTNAIL